MFCYIYNRIIQGKVINKNYILQEFNINQRSFYRYIKDIKNFISKPDGDLIGNEIIVDRKNGGYILKDNIKKNLNEKEVLAISKVLLESRGFINDEIQAMINKILDNCIFENKEKIKRIIGNELINYVSPQHGKELLDKLWNISNAINEQKILKIGYSKMGIDGKLQDEVFTRIIYPQAILFSEYYFYIIAFIEGKAYEYPTIYRVDRIKDLIITDKRYKIEYSNRFKDGEYKKLVNFMQTGRIQRVRFKFTGKSIEAVLDKLPNAKVINEKQGAYVVETKMFGKGIKMWLLSQGEDIEVISPDEFRREMIETIQKMKNVYK
ncbi:WYL domain-containing protein [Clostridium botulinum C]|uniref:helix-turn-helix transcriptional regulator n=1 Tax=Clostridium botulinum TaxID=1491 RepID=UPI001E435AC8|nr:WYL domain-containing protein [Clostridium botulinum]MCD3245449.1 WYL domain-containing protein [Clostridium botulinum C]MCD3261828.1 WYL domain-containing protein [Clostridium botulinum C]